MAALGPKLRTLEVGRIVFWCPGCDSMHQVKVADGPRPHWGFNDNGDKPTFWPSLLVNQSGRYHNPRMPTCHSLVTDGRIAFLGDCTHKLAGQTVDLPNFDEECARRVQRKD